MRMVVWVASVSALAALSGCGSASQFQARPQYGHTASVAPAYVIPQLVQRDHRKSWIAPEARKAAELLFESDPGTGDVEMFSLPDLTLKGRITGFAGPLGECTDARGNVWVANYGPHELDEYSHGGARLNKITTPTYYVWSCAVSLRNGAIAITISNRPRSKPGEVLIYASPSSPPSILRNPEQLYYYFAAFDAGGALWVDGLDNLGHFILSKCDGKTCSTMSLTGGSIFSPGAVAWDDLQGRLVIFDTFCRDIVTICSYPVSTGGVVGRPTFYVTHRNAALCFMSEAALATSGTAVSVVGADNEYSCTSYKKSTVDVWVYPKGGKPAFHRQGVVVSPFGATVSMQR